MVSHGNGQIALERVGRIVEQVCRLVDKGKEVLLVSSGSIGIGRQRIRLQKKMMNRRSDSSSRNDDLIDENDDDINARICASAGQSGLMALYETMFQTQGVSCSQVKKGKERKREGKERKREGKGKERNEKIILK